MALDILSYEIGKQSAGGSTPTGTINITENRITDVTNYANADVNVQPNLETKNVTITENKTTTITPTSGKDGLSSVEVITNVPSSGDDWSDIGYSSTPKAINDIHTYSKQFYDNWDDDNPTRPYNSIYQNNLVVFPLVNTSNVSSFSQWFRGCSQLREIPAIIVSTDNTGLMFRDCSQLTKIDFSNFDMSNNTYPNAMFQNCTKLDNDTLNQILYLCTTMTSLDTSTSPKTLAMLSITSSFINYSNIPNLSNYQAFLDAGWTIS